MPTREIEMLKTALGPTLLKLLDDDQVLEIMLNPDGELMIEHVHGDKRPVEADISAEQSMNIIRLLATLNDQVVHRQQPLLSAPLMISHARFQGMIPPVVARPCFSIRKHITHPISLGDYVNSGAMTQTQHDQLKEAVLTRKNIVVAGGASSGKTTLAKALINELKDSPDRILILEDLPELVCEAEDVVTMLSTPEVDMHNLVKASLRMRPDRIIVGEVRDGTALDLLKAWNTGHPGGICTLHANTAQSVYGRLSDLVQEAVHRVPEHLIEEAVDMIVFMQHDKNGVRKVSDIL